STLTVMRYRQVYVGYESLYKTTTIAITATTIPSGFMQCVSLGPYDSRRKAIIKVRSWLTRGYTAAQRPSRTQVVAKAPSNSNSPISPANIGSTPTPLTTLASRIFTPIQPSPWKMPEARTGTTRGRSTLVPSTTRRASPPVACASGFSISVVEVTSDNSFGLAVPTLIRAFSAPSVACHSPSSLGGRVEGMVTGSYAVGGSWLV